MSNEPAFPSDAADPWVIPLHGIEAPVERTTSRPTPSDDATAEFFDDDEIPTIEFRPRLRRSA